MYKWACICVQILTSSKLAELYADLKVHDKHEGHLKKLIAQNMDQDGAMEIKVVTNYRSKNVLE